MLELVGFIVVVCLFMLVAILRSIKIMKRKKNEKKEKSDLLESQNNKILTDNNFVVSKEIKTSELILLVDDQNKQFAIATSKDVLSNASKQPLRVLKYSELLDYELNEDGSSILKGKGLATATGALAFGLVGAAIGASGKRKSESTCNLLEVRLKVRDLQNPEIVVKYISTEMTKSSFLYTQQINKAKEFCAVLAFIEDAITA